MKKILLSTLFSILTLITLTLISSLILSLIHYKCNVSINKYVVFAVSTAIFFLSGFVYGLLNKKQGLLGSIFFILVYLIYCLIDMFVINKGDFDKVLILFIALKCITYTCGAILSVNISKN